MLSVAFPLAGSIFAEPSEVVVPVLKSTTPPGVPDPEIDATFATNCALSFKLILPGSTVKVSDVALVALDQEVTKTFASTEPKPVAKS